MTDLAQLLTYHLHYTVWASDRLVQASSQITTDERQHNFNTADGSIQNTLTHLLRAERSWLRRIDPTLPKVPWALPQDEVWENLVPSWQAVHQDWMRWASGLSTSSVEAVLDYTDLKGNRWQQPIWQIVLHVVNHSTHHRGQVSGFLRALGHTPPPIDFIVFARGL